MRGSAFVFREWTILGHAAPETESLLILLVSRRIRDVNKCVCRNVGHTRVGVSLAAGENRPKSSIAGASTSGKSMKFLFSWFMIQLRGTVPRSPILNANVM